MKKSFSFIVLMLSLFQFISAQPTQQWLNRHNGIGDFSDKFNAIAIDTFNNIYCTGYTFSTNNAEDALTIKLNPIGDTIWTRSFNGTANNTDETVDITTDLFGNVYVTGVTKGTISGKDFLTIKYNSNGDTLWTRTYNGSGNGDDDAISISIDPTGNVYVTGKSDGDLSSLVNNDIVTIKYSSTGNQLWVVRYNGAGNGTDNSAGIVSNDTGDVYVAGRTFNGIDDDIIVIKYSTSGIQQWLKIFDGGNGNDRASSISIDGSSNIYIGGRTNNGADDDFIALKYNTIGTQLWFSTYDGGFGNDRASSITVDPTGNVYITGKTLYLSTDDYLTIKYNSTGTQLWASRWAGTGNGNDAANAITLDAIGNVYVTGQSDSDPSAIVNNNYSTVKYNSAGVLSWAQSYNGSLNKNDSGNDIITDRIGNIIVTGNCQNIAAQKDGTTIKYNNSGAAVFIHNYSGVGDNSDKANAVYVDASGYTYITGYSVVAGNGKDICTIKYNSLGDTVWVKKYDGLGNGNDEGNAITVDASGNVYVTGYSKGINSYKDFTTIKYNSLGDTIWVRKYDGTGNGDDLAVSIKVDLAGNVYITGYSDGDITTSGINNDYTTIKYSPTGTQLWATRYNGVGNGNDQAVGIVIDGSSNCYVSGRTDKGGDDDFATIKYNSAGAQQWIRIFDGGNGNDRASAITTDASSNIYVTGRYDNGNDDDFATIKYNSAGIQQWISFYDGLNGNDRATNIAVDPTGNVCVTGQSSAGLTDNFLTVKYNASGTQQWAKIYNGTANGNDVPSSILFDGVGNILVAGQSDNGTALIKNKDYTIIKYDNNGTQLWAISYDGGASSGTDGINSMAIDNMNNIYVTGTSFSFSGQKDIVTIKYNSPVGINEYERNENSVSIYPNPFSTFATIEIGSKNFQKNKNYTFKMFDILGNEVVTLNNIQSNKFILKRENLCSGLYMYTIHENDNLFNSGKIIIEN